MLPAPLATTAVLAPVAKLLLLRFVITKMCTINPSMRLQIVLWRKTMHWP